MPEFLTIIVPTLDEERHLDRCVRSLLDDPYPRDRLELLVVDGGSSDDTLAIAEGLRSDFPMLRVLHNPRRLQSAAFNLGLREADPRTTCLLRCDAHAEYPPGFVTRAVETLERVGAGVVGSRAVPVAKGAFQRAVAFAQSTPVGVGGSSYRLGGNSGWVDSAMHGCFSRSAVERVGGYDEHFSHNEDAELSLRLRQAGYGVWLDDGLRIAYYPRESPGGLTRQYFSYGRGRAMTCVKHGIVPRPRQLAPVLLIAAELALAAVAARRPRALLALTAYLAALESVAFVAAARRRDAAVLLGGPALAIMHHAWGAGFLIALAGATRRRRRAP